MRNGRTASALRAVVGLLCLHVWHGSAAAATTFAADVAPILARHCTTCHRPGGASRSSLVTFADVRARADQIVSTTSARQMPPWLPEGAKDLFADDRRLTEQEIDTLRRWRDEGTPEGDVPTQAVENPALDRWRFGTPDLVLTTPSFTVEPGASQRVPNVVLPVSLDRARYVRAWEIRASNPALVRHATLIVDASRTPSVFDVDASLVNAGYLLPSSALDPLLFDWTPGDEPGVATAGAAWPFGPFGQPMFHVDVAPVEKPETLSLSVALYYSEQEPSRIPATLRLTRQGLEIPAGSTTFTATDSSEIPTEVDIETVQVHANRLGSQVVVSAVTPDMRELRLLSVSQWNDVAPQSYRLANPVRLPAGSTVTMNIRYDNSRANPRNPATPPINVRLGPGNADEVAEVWLRVLPVRSDERPVLVERVHRHGLAEDIKGRTILARDDPRRPDLRELLAVALADSGDLSGAEREFRIAQSLRPSAAAPHYNIGMAILGQGRQDEATQWFTSALATEPQHAPSLLQLGLHSQARGDLAAASSYLGRAVASRPHDPNMLLAAGVVDALTGKGVQATARMRHALELRPAWANAEAALALALSAGPGHTPEEQREAIELAERANERTRHRVTAFLDILAGAFAAAGDRERALTTAHEALALAEETGDTSAAANMRARIRALEAGPL